MPVPSGQLDEYDEERKDEELLSQIAQLENLNQTLKIEFQEMVEEKAKISKELEEVRSSRDMGMNQLTTFEEQVQLCSLVLVIFFVVFCNRTSTKHETGLLKF